MGKVDYQKIIKETAEELKEIERSEKIGKYRDRVRFIRHLKEGTARTQEEAAKLISLKRRQGHEIWKLYMESGLSGIIKNNYKGSWVKLTSQQISRLLQRLDCDDIHTQADIQRWLQSEMGIHYTQSGISMLFSAIKVKLKTGRPVNVRKDVAAEQEFKKKIQASK